MATLRLKGESQHKQVFEIYLFVVYYRGQLKRQLLLHMKAASEVDTASNNDRSPIINAIIGDLVVQRRMLVVRMGELACVVGDALNAGGGIKRRRVNRATPESLKDATLKQT